MSRSPSASARRLLALASLALCAGCRTPGELDRNALRHRPPPAAQRAFEEAREALETGELDVAEERLREAAAGDPAFVRARRRLQDLQVATLRRGDALEEARAAVRAAPGDAQPRYLLARLRQGAAQHGLLEEAIERDPWYGWAWLGLSAHAESHVEPGAGLELAARASRLLPLEPDPLYAVARIELEQGRVSGPVPSWFAGLIRFPEDAARFAELGLRAQVRREGRRPTYLPSIAELVRDLGPKLLRTPSGCDALLRAVEAGLVPAETRARLEDDLADARHADDASADDGSAGQRVARARLAAALAESQGETARAALERERAYAEGDVSFALARELSLAHVRAARFVDAVSVYRRSLEPLLGSLPGATAQLDGLAAAAAHAEEHRGDPEALLAFARTASECGWLAEAEEAAARAEADGGGDAARTLREEVGGFRRLLRRLRDAGRSEGGASLSLRNTLARLRESTVAAVGFDAIEGSRVEDHFPVGALLDTRPGAPGLPALFDRHGIELRLGKRMLGPLEAFALRRLEARELEGDVLGRKYRGREVLGEAQSVHTVLEAGGARFAGATLPGSVFIVLDAVADQARAIEAERASMEADRAAGRPILPEMALPTIRSREQRLAADEPLELARLLVRRALERDPSPAAPRVLEIVRLHELGHLADADAFLPIAAHVHDIIAWLFAAGFSTARIEARLERRAELVALCLSEDPELVLAEIAGACEAPAARPPHSAGFADLARDLLAETERRRERGALPALSGDHPLLPQLWRLEPAEIRSIARTVAAEEGLVAEGWRPTRP